MCVCVFCVVGLLCVGRRVGVGVIACACVCACFCGSVCILCL